MKFTVKQDRLEHQETPDGFLLRPRRIDLASLAPLRDKIRRDPGPFDLEEFRISVMTRRFGIDTAVEC